MTTARELFDQADLILLDFDGPVTRLLPPPSNAELASRAKDACLAAGVPLSPEEQRSTDHLSFIRAAGNYSRAALAVVENLCRDGEVAAVATSPLTPGAEDVLKAAKRRGKVVIIVTNNSPDCVDLLLATRRLTEYVSRVIGRHPTKPRLMKPNPHILVDALTTSHGKAIMIGDSVSDIEAARAVSIPAVGLAKNSERELQLAQAGSSAVVTTMLDLTQPNANKL